MAFKYNKARKIYANDPKNPGKRIPVGQKQYGYGKVRYISYGPLEKKKPTMKDFFRAIARDSGLLRNKIESTLDNLGFSKSDSKGNRYLEIDPGNKNIQEAKAIALDAQRLPSVDAPNTRNTGALKYTPKQKDYKITSASANKKRTSGGRVLTKPAPVRMSNVVELENFVQRNMVAVSKNSGGANTMREDYKINSLMANKPRTSGGRVKKKNPAAEWWRNTGGTTIPKYGDYNTIGQNNRNLKQKNNKSFQMPAWWKKMKARYDADQDWKGNPR